MKANIKSLVILSVVLGIALVACKKESMETSIPSPSRTDSAHVTSGITNPGDSSQTSGGGVTQSGGGTTQLPGGSTTNSGDSSHAPGGDTSHVPHP